MSFASTVPEGEMDTYEGGKSASFKNCSGFHLERWNGCASQATKSLLTATMCNQDSLYKSSDGMEAGDEQQTDWSEEEENSSGKTGV